ncbi:hypothetical protein PG994_001056 [Apiospora phragmitis]|uniref:Uncharacterized protein n=1 Tax=Apiospora phragmitis TaxID=2905665 RepID=A0ABR1WSF6_9PEZI
MISRYELSAMVICFTDCDPPIAFGEINCFPFPDSRQRHELSWALPRDEADAIYGLAEESFNDDELQGQEPVRQGAAPPRHEFAPLSGAISTAKFSRSWFDAAVGLLNARCHYSFLPNFHCVLHRLRQLVFISA